MPVRVTEIPGLSHTAVNAPRMSPAAAAAPGRALGELAEGLASVSKPFALIAHGIQETENARQLSEVRTQLDEARTNLLIDLQKDPEPASHLRKTDEFLSQQKQLLDRPDLSPVVRDRLTLYFDEWATNTRTNIAMGAARLAQRKAATTLENEMVRAYELNDPGRLRTAFDDAVAAGVKLPEEWDGIARDFQQKQQRDQELRDIHADPGGWLDENTAPPATGDPVAWMNNRRTAQTLLRQQTAEAVDQIQDRMADGTITRPEQLDELAGDLRPAVLDSLKAELAKRGDLQEQARRATPEYQAEIVGRVSAKLASYKIDGDNFDEDYVEIDNMIRSLPDSAAKAELAKNLRQIRDGQKRELETIADFHRRALDDLYKGGAFGSAVSSQSVQSAVDAGLLRDEAKLLAAGFDEDQAEQILEAKTDRDRLRLVRELYTKRPNPPTGDPYDMEAFHAIAKGSARIEREDPAKRAAADRAYGEAKTKLEAWLRANPTATEEEGRRKLYELVSPTGLVDFSRHLLLPPPPVEIDDEDTPPMLLPPMR